MAVAAGFPRDEALLSLFAPYLRNSGLTQANLRLEGNAPDAFTFTTAREAHDPGGAELTLSL